MVETNGNFVILFCSLFECVMSCDFNHCLRLASWRPDDRIMDKKLTMGRKLNIEINLDSGEIPNLSE